MDAKNAITGKAAIFGTAGAIGPYIAAELNRRSIEFRAVGGRRAALEKVAGTMSYGEIFTADLSDREAASRAAQGIDSIFYCMGLPYPEHRLHPVLMRTTLEAAVAQQVKRI